VKRLTYLSAADLELIEAAQLTIGVKHRSEVRIGGKPYLWDKPL